MLPTPLAVVRPRWLLTSRAHRLRKPHRTTQTSGILCRRAGLEPSASRSLPLAPALPGLGLVIVGLAQRLTRTQDAFRRLDPRPCDRSRLARAPFDVRPRSPRTLSPTANRSSSFLVDRRVRLTPASSKPFGPVLRSGRCVYPASATDLQHEHSIDRSALESPPPSAFTVRTASTPAARPRPGGEHDQVELRLTASFQLQHGVHDRPRCPEELSLLVPAGS